MVHSGSLCSFDSGSIQDILDALHEGVIAVDKQMQVVASNRAAMDFVGMTAAESVGVPFCSLFGEGSCPVDCLRETLETGRSIQDYQTSVRLSDGRPAQVLLRTVPLSRDGGPVEGVAMIIRDVTEVTSLRKASAPRSGFAGMIGNERRMCELYELIESVAPTNATVLVRGETGTGKELVARALHFSSARADGPFVAVNCSALSETLLESELFGHVRGSFTGAISDRKGRFEEARGGTIFLDEVGDVNPVVQVKLLRVLQERTVERVGDSKSVSVDVRVVAATNRDLEKLMATGKIREDFYYRIRVVSLDVPPLRERSGDIPALVDHFLERHGIAGERLGATTLGRLMAYRWPGNIRELEHAVEHAVVLSRGGEILPRHLPTELSDGSTLVGTALHSDDERSRIQDALERQHWHRNRTAAELGIDRTTLWRKIREYDLKQDD